jgi:hypothetical protein
MFVPVESRPEHRVLPKSTLIHDKCPNIELSSHGLNWVIKMALKAKFELEKCQFKKMQLTIFQNLL